MVRHSILFSPLLYNNDEDFPQISYNIDKKIIVNYFNYFLDSIDIDIEYLDLESYLFKIDIFKVSFDFISKDKRYFYCKDVETFSLYLYDLDDTGIFEAYVNDCNYLLCGRKPKLTEKILLKKIKESRVFYQELYEKTWHPTRMQQWCLAIDDI